MEPPIVPVRLATPLLRRKSNGLCEVFARPDCLAFEYLKTMASIGTRLAACSPQTNLNLCFIGGGGFTLPLFFSHLYEHSVIDAVELDPRVITAATQHMGVKNPRFNILQADGADYIKQCNASGRTLDMLFLDAFDGEDEVPHFCCDPDGRVLQALAHVLHPDHGSVIINIHGGSISSAFSINNLVGRDCGFNKNSTAGRKVLQVISLFSESLLVAKSRQDGCCFSLATIHQDNIIVIVTRGIRDVTNERKLEQILCSGSFVTLPFQEIPRLKRGLTLW